MAYTVLARRYRATTFTGVVGQQTVIKTLRNAIAASRVAHAYLFTGTRGVGKTSMARIFARALNAPATVEDCPQPSDAQQYPDLDVQQRMAEVIMRGEDLNVIEIDAASNSGVEEARRLIANAGLLPTGNAQYKIYIIDEVHMLSPQAFNALLKTMEEPPSHVKFILCTTESNKVPPTIQSRCQRFDFRNIATPAIAEHLRHVLAQEKIEADDDIVWRLARLGNGSMRDALSLLDRLIAAGEQPLTLSLLEQMLGLPRQQMVIDLIDDMADANIAAVLQKTAALLDEGIAQDQLVDVLIDRLRQLMLVEACGVDSDLVELSDDARVAAAQQAGRFDAPGIVYMIALCENLQRNAKLSSNPRAMLDVTVVRLALAEKMADVTAVLSGDQPAAKPAGKKKSSEVAGPTPAADKADQVIDTSDLHAVWHAVMACVEGKPSLLHWVRNLELIRLGDREAMVRLTVADQNLHRFVSQQSQRLSELMQEVLGRQVYVQVADLDAAAQPNDTPPSAEQVEHVDQQTVMSLPLVRQVLEHFDADLIHARRDKT